MRASNPRNEEIFRRLLGSGGVQCLPEVTTERLIEIADVLTELEVLRSRNQSVADRVFQLCASLRLRFAAANAYKSTSPAELQQTLKDLVLSPAFRSAEARVTFSADHESRLAFPKTDL